MLVISVRLKILAVVLGFFALIGLAFILYSSVTTQHYRELRMEAVFLVVELESERVSRNIDILQRSVGHFSLLGEQAYRAQRRSEEIGQNISFDDFGNRLVGVGAGIWFEPFAVRDDIQRAGVYTFYDWETRTVHNVPEFFGEEYDYHSQDWYLEIAPTLVGPFDRAWSTPYFKKLGRESLITTVGAGIFDDDGNLVGVATNDWVIESLIERLTAVSPTRGSFVLLASPADDIIIANTLAGGEGTGSSATNSTPSTNWTYSDWLMATYGASTYTPDALSGLTWYGNLRFSPDGEQETGRFDIDGVTYISFSEVFENGWIFSVQVPENEIFEVIESRNARYSFLIATLSLVVLGLTYLLISHMVNRPLKKLATGVLELGGGDLDGKIDIQSKDEFGTLASTFNKMTVDLKRSIEESALERAEKERIGAELSIAATIQINMLPRIFPAFPDRPEFDLFAIMRPAKEVGGDFYDFFMLDADTLAVVIADVSGKGVPAALFMVIAKTLIKNNAQHGKSPKEVFETVNDLLGEGNEADMFVTAFMGFLDIPTGKFTYVNAGHEPPLVRRSGGEFEKLPVHPNLMLAGFDGMTYRQEETTLKSGDMLFLYTDGVTEAANMDEELFGISRIIETVNNNKSADATGLLHAVRDKLIAFANGALQADDVTMLALEIKGSARSDRA